MNKKELQQVASQIKKANNAIKQAINAVNDYQRFRFHLDFDLEEEDTRKLANLLKDYYSENEFDSPFGFYASIFQDFDADMRILEKAIKL